MISDYYGFLYTGEKDLLLNNGALASGFMDGTTVQYAKREIEAIALERKEKEFKKGSEEQKQIRKDKRDVEGQKNKIRQKYIDEAKKEHSHLPASIEFQWPSTWPSDWVGFEIYFTLQTPWYSKDDRPFHVLDNPLRKELVFGVPFMSASSWKGMLRWAFAMRTGQIGPSPEPDEEKLKFYQKQILYLFGNERGAQNDFQSGALQFYPTWFDKIDFELINPHDRARRAGTNPIIYEVLPAGTEGILKLLYAPAPGEVRRDGVDKVECLSSLVDAIQHLLETYGISAKRTVGWGRAKISSENSKVWIREDNVLGSLIDKISIDKDSKEYTPPKAEFKELMDDNGNPISILLKDGKLVSKTQFKKLGDAKPCIGDSGQCTSRLYEEFCAWYKDNGSQYEKSLDTKEGEKASSQIREYPWTKFTEVMKIQNARKGGEQ